jgi:hypothetical protein
MSFKPLDLQVNISQLNHVARMQQNEQSHPNLVQTHHQGHLAREAERTQTTVMETAKSKEESTTKDVLVRDEDAHEESLGGRQKKGERERQKEKPTVRTFESYESSDKGSLIDIKR